MKRRLGIIFVILTFVGCASPVVKEGETVKKNKTTDDLNNKKIAQERFIDGSIWESKEQYNEAISQYLEALKFDPQPGIYYTIAKNYYRLNKLSSALKYSQKSTELESKNIDYLFLLATIYSASRLEDSSIAVYQKIVAIDSVNTSAYYQLAQLYEKNRPSYSISLYKKIIDLIGPEWSVLVKLIELNERMGNVKESIQTLEELLKLNPSDLRLQKLLIDAFIKTNDYERAVKLINESLASFPDDIGLIELKGTAYIHQEKWKEAFEEYRKFISKDEIDYETKLRIGAMFLAGVEKNSVNLEYAKSILKQMEQDSLDWQATAYLGEIEVRQKNDSLAIEYFKKATQLAEWNSQIWVRLGGLLFDNRKYKEAISLMHSAVEKFPNDFVLNLIYGLSLSQVNDHIKAKIYLERAVKLNPRDLTALSALGFSLNQLKEDDEALKYLNKALILDPNSTQVLSMVALIYDSKQNFVMSDSLYNRAMEIDSNNVLILNNYAYSLAERKIRLEEALQMSQKAVKQEPKNASYLDTIGWIYYQLGDYKKSKEYIESATEIEKNNATLIDHLGDIYFKLGNKHKAMELWKKALELEPDNQKFKNKIEKGEL